jgi:hypothetical protein
MGRRVNLPLLERAAVTLYRMRWSCPPGTRLAGEPSAVWSLVESGLERPSLISSPQLRCDYPLNLSILLSGGKETN